MQTWLNTFLTEKNIDTEATLEVEGQSGLNIIPVGCLVEAIVNAPLHEQKAIKGMLVKIDFLNGNVLDYFRHLAQAIAL